MINVPFLTFLAIASAVTVFFSMFTTPSVRGYRNLGFLVIYLGSLIGLFVVGWRPVCVTWIAFGLISGFLYFAYELISAARSQEETKEGPSLITIVHGLAAWPIMLPEVIEYSLADMGFLKVAGMPAADTPTDSAEEESGAR